MISEHNTQHEFYLFPNGHNARVNIKDIVGEQRTYSLRIQFEV